MQHQNRLVSVLALLVTASQGSETQIESPDKSVRAALDLSTVKDRCERPLTVEISGGPSWRSERLDFTPFPA